MDINGALELTRRLGANAEVHLDPEPPRPVTAKDAAPIFHWFGVEPQRRERAAERAPEPTGTGRTA